MEASILVFSEDSLSTCFSQILFNVLNSTPVSTTSSVQGREGSTKA